jgi:hypothetical protein
MPDFVNLADLFPISLAEKPKLMQMGFATHGKQKFEHYQIYCWTLHLYFYSGNITVDGRVHGNGRGPLA